MGKSNAFETAMFNLVFVNLDIALIGDAAGLQNSTGNGYLYVSLHTADPGEAGSQTTSEATYTSYARQQVDRVNPGSGFGWNVSGNQVSNWGGIYFPAATGGSETITHWGVGTDSSGAGVLLYKGALSASLSVSSGVEPAIGSGGLVITEE